MEDGRRKGDGVRAEGGWWAGGGIAVAEGDTRFFGGW
jgi:hypothetical protein